MQFTTLAIALLPTVALAQYGYDTPSTTSTTLTPVAKAAASSSAVNGVHIVKVGKDNLLTFEPNTITAAVGETVEFHFWPKAHSIAQSSFDKPCVPLSDSSFFSGPVVIASGMSPTVYSINVTAATPIWFYCATGAHCQNGMGGVINPPAANATRTLTNYLAVAKANNVNEAPAKVQGGVLGAAAVAGSPTASPSASTTPNAASGAAAVSWGLLGVAGLVAGAFV